MLVALLRIPARVAGFVPKREVDKIIERMEAVEQQLRHKTFNLEHELELRKLLEDEIEHMRKVELQRTKNETVVQQACDRLEAVATELEQRMEEFARLASGDSALIV